MSNGENMKYGSVDSIFALCETCHWCATYLDKSRVPNNKCPTCGNTSISTFPILPNEEFTYYNEKRGAELEFGLRKKVEIRVTKEDNDSLTPSKKVSSIQCVLCNHSFFSNLC